MNIDLRIETSAELDAFAEFAKVLAAIERAKAERYEARVRAYAVADGLTPCEQAGIVLDEAEFFGTADPKPADVPYADTQPVVAVEPEPAGAPTPPYEKITRKRRTKAEIEAAIEAAKAVAESVTVEPAAISTGEERVAPDDAPEVQAQDAADEAAESAATRTASVTHDDIRVALGEYMKKFGMLAAVEDRDRVMKKIFPDAKSFDVAGIPNDMIGVVLAGVKEMTAKNPFERAEVAA